MNENNPTNPVNHVTFTATGPIDTPPAPVSAAENLPAWYQYLPSTVDELESHHKNTSVKMCMPFSDALKTGWLLRSPVALTIKTTNPGTEEFADIEITTPAKTSDEHVVDSLAPAQREFKTNSTFRLPNIVLNTSWSITTPDNYSTLITPLLNRSENRFTPHSLLIETAKTATRESTEETRETTPIHLPIHIPEAETPVTIERGDPIATILPIDCDALLSPVIETYNETSRFGKLKTAMRRLNDSRTSAYREEMWTPKPSAKTVTDTAELPQKHVNQSGNDEPHPKIQNADADAFAEDNRPFIPDDTSYVFYCHEKYDTATPDPKPASEHIPNGYITAIQNVLSNTSEYSPNTITNQIADAMRLGHIIELDREMRIVRPDDTDAALIAESIAKDNSHQHDPRKAGEKHPFAPLEMLNIFSEWSVVLPHGYSNLYIQPLNHFQQHHKSFSGIVDADWHSGEVNIPGRFTKRTDDVILERGTPITQAIPIHRESLLKYAVINR